LNLRIFYVSKLEPGLDVEVLAVSFCVPPLPLAGYADISAPAPMSAANALPSCRPGALAIFIRRSWRAIALSAFAARTQPLIWLMVLKAPLEIREYNPQLPSSGAWCFHGFPLAGPGAELAASLAPVAIGLKRSAARLALTIERLDCWVTWVGFFLNLREQRALSRTA
jgi:hypothetical protein